MKKEIFLIVLLLLFLSIIIVMYSLYPFQYQLKPKLTLKVFTNVTKVGGNETCATVFIPYFANLTFDGRKVTEGEVYVRLLDSQGEEKSSVNLYYNPNREVWTISVMYSCLNFGKYIILANATATVNDQTLHAIDRIEISV